MINEEKELLLKDLCGRLPYGVKCTTNSSRWTDGYTITGYNNNEFYINCPIYNKGDNEWLIEFIVPYLRPMSSMTEEEMEDYARYKFLSDEIWEIVDFKRMGKGFIIVNCKNRNDASTRGTFQVNQKSPLENHRGIDWLNRKMFDYRGLIPMGLALPAKEGMYK